MPVVHGAVALDFMACPNCGTRLNASCGHCSKPLQAGWHFCPYCAQRVGGTGEHGLVTTSARARPSLSSRKAFGEPTRSVAESMVSGQL